MRAIPQAPDREGRNCIVSGLYLGIAAFVVEQGW
jgi:hypothetical protein